MAIQFSKLDKVTATITGLAADGTTVAAIQNFNATVPDETIVKLENINPTAGTVDIVGVADGDVTITYTAQDDNGDPLTLTDTITISDVVVPPLATSLSVSYSTPVAQ